MRSNPRLPFDLRNLDLFGGPGSVFLLHFFIKRTFLLKRLSHSVGLEYWYTNLIALRAGYCYEDPSYGDRQFWTFGGGVRISFLGVDFSYILASADNHPLSDTMRFSLSANF